MNSAEAFKNLRKKLELNQVDFAKLLNMKQSTLSNYETGKRKPSLISCYKIINLVKLKNIHLSLEDLRPEE